MGSNRWMWCEKVPNLAYLYDKQTRLSICSLAVNLAFCHLDPLFALYTWNGKRTTLLTSLLRVSLC